MNDCPSGAGAPALHRVVSFRLCFMYPWFHRFSDQLGGRQPSPTWARLLFYYSSCLHGILQQPPGSQQAAVTHSCSVV